ncbi:MAG: hypothetical protein QXT86_10485 [Archaeoglobaceae archaeon]
MAEREEILRELGLAPIEDTKGETTINLPPTAEPFGIPTDVIPAGLEKFGDSIVAMAVKGLEMALAIFGSSSEKGQAILSALNRLSKIVDEKELMKAEMALEGLFLGGPGLPVSSGIAGGPGVGEIPGASELPGAPGLGS